MLNLFNFGKKSGLLHVENKQQALFKLIITSQTLEDARSCKPSDRLMSKMTSDFMKNIDNLLQFEFFFTSNLRPSKWYGTDGVKWSCPSSERDE